MSDPKYSDGQSVFWMSSRRQFLSQTAAIGVAGGLMSTLPGPTLAATPKKGGRLRLGVTDSATTETFDTAVLVTIAPMVATLALKNCLVELDHTSNPLPELAESGEASDDATQWVFKLRKDVEFHNGKSLEAEDVLFSFNRHRGEATKSQVKALLTSVEDIKADGNHTVIFKLSGGSADFPYIVSDYRTSISPAGTEDFDAGIGTGGYILENFEPGIRINAKRNPNYWKNGRAHFDEFEVLGINDAAARNNALVTGEVDVINRCELKTFDRLSKTPGIKGLSTPSTAHYTVPMRTDTPPFANNDVRLALKFAVDREVLLSTILRGQGTVGNDHPIGQSDRFFASEISQRQYDPEKAKFHLKQAGLSSLSVQLFTSDAAFAGAVDAAVLYKEHAVKAGIDIEVVKSPADGYWDDVWMKKPWSFSYWFGRPTADWMFTLVYADTSTQNETFWKNERFNKILVEARGELDNSKRREMYVELQQICRDEGGAVIPLFNNDIMAASDKLQFNELATNFQMDGLRLIERWWFA